MFSIYCDLEAHSHKSFLALPIPPLLTFFSSNVAKTTFVFIATV
ncbi:hypothetical protein PSPO_a2324 [Pseudoalteromonas spongiae UST010723-006]|nr:hypothetical protein PSPO_a2324 [Pseudoalteromonas spongiae UST010723-006]